MKKEILLEKGLTEEQVTFVMAENGKVVQSEQNKANQLRDAAVAKAESPLKDTIKTLEGQIADLKKAAENIPNIDEATQAAVKDAVDKLSADHKTALGELTKKHAEESAAVRRDADTKDFFHNLGKKFITPETQTVFEQKLNEALLDKINEGKNRADLFATLIADAEGKERTDIFAVSDDGKGRETKPPHVTGGTNPPPPSKSGGDNFLAGFYGEH